MSVRSCISLFVCTRRVHKLLIRTPGENLMAALSTQCATLYSLWCSCCSHMPLMPSVSEVQSPFQLCLRSGAVGGLLPCRHGTFHCQCLPIPSHLRSLADPVMPTTRLRKHCTPRPCNPTSHRGVGWLSTFKYGGSLYNKKESPPPLWSNLHYTQNRITIKMIQWCCTSVERDTFCTWSKLHNILLPHGVTID